MKRLLLCLFLPLASCVTTTTTHPDGSITKVSRQDPKVVRALTVIVSEVGAAAAKATIDQLSEDQSRKSQ